MSDKTETKIGVESWLQPENGKNDLFEAEEFCFHFPCGECVHRIHPEEICKQCRHWVKI